MDNGIKILSGGYLECTFPKIACITW